MSLPPPVERCKARFYEDRDDATNWRSHQCRYRSVTERTVSVGPAGPRRIPVCRIHERQRRADFTEYRS